jgi:predicted GTPase
VATPIDLRRIVKIKKPSVRVHYDLQEIGKPDLADALGKYFVPAQKSKGKAKAR